MLFPVSNWRLCPLSSGDPCRLGPWARLERADGMASALASVPGWSREGRQHKERQLALAPGGCLRPSVSPA